MGLRLFLVRPAETLWNRERRYPGRADTPLPETGRGQAEAVARALGAQSLAAVYSSPLQRARDTAAAIARAQGHDVRAAEAFKEMGFGRWEGLTVGEARALDPGLYQAWLDSPVQVTPPGAEGPAAVRGGVLAGLDTVRAEHDDTSVCLVTHAVVARVLILEALGLPLDRLWTLTVSATGISELGFRADWTAVHRMNTRVHLDALPGSR